MDLEEFIKLKSPPLIYYPNRILNTPCKDLDITQAELISKTANILLNKLRSFKTGLGLAAPQLGLLYNLLVCDVSKGAKANKMIVMINPKIVAKSIKSETEYESCLSIPDVQVLIKRPKKVTIEYIDQNIKTIKRTFEKLEGRVIQHEIDHLAGITILEKGSIK